MKASNYRLLCRWLSVYDCQHKDTFYYYIVAEWFLKSLCVQNFSIYLYISKTSYYKVTLNYLYNACFCMFFDISISAAVGLSAERFWDETITKFCNCDSTFYYCAGYCSILSRKGNKSRLCLCSTRDICAGVDWPCIQSMRHLRFRQS